MSGEEGVDGTCVRVRVPSKVNLFLAVRGRRQDGFHELVTVMQTMTLTDELKVGVYGPPGQGHHPAARRRMQLELRVEGELDPASAAAMGTPENNLVIRAAELLGEHTKMFSVKNQSRVRDLDDSLPRTVLRLSKRIPVAGGMAGGSADAAGALVALNELWDCRLPREELRDLAGQLGSDVPFCVVGGTALATGRGTRVAQVLSRGSYHWVVCRSDRPLSTGDVYAAWDEHARATQVEPDAVLAALRSQDAEALGAALYNDLESAAFTLRPELVEQRQSLLDAGALGAVVSGSGPTLLALAESEAHAQRLAYKVASDFHAVHVVRSPAAGPEAKPCDR